MEKISNFRGAFRSDMAARAVYSEAAGIGQIIPRAIAVPQNADDVVAAVTWAAQAGVPIVARGSGSSMAGGAIGDGLVLDLSRLRDNVVIDAAAQMARCGAGVLRDEVDAAARAVGLRFPVDPSSGAYCTVGGMASTNSAGAHTMRHGAMRAWVNGLDCVFADGTRAMVRRGEPMPEIEAIRRFRSVMPALLDAERRSSSRRAGVRKESSGYGVAAFAESGELVDLLVGSEGTLALFVGLELRLMPRHACSASVLGAFRSLDDAVAGAIAARVGGASCCELLDRTFLDVARRGGVRIPAPDDTEAILLSDVEGETQDECELAARSLSNRFRDAGAMSVEVALDESTDRAMWALRHAASPALSRLDPALKSMQFIEDGCVPPERLADYVSGVREALARQQIRGVIFGHAGDAHVHVNPLVDVREPDWRSRVEALLLDVTRLTARLGGTVSGEHGDGRLRTPLLGASWPAEVLDRFRLVKGAFDPAGLLNPGVKVALPGTRAIDRVKYDPALPSLPSGARAALSRVEETRAYARSRLDVLAECEREAARTTESS